MNKKESKGNESLAVLILAAGLGKRMGAGLPKVVVKTREKPLINHVLDVVDELDASKVIIVTGHKREIVESVVVEHRQKAASSINFAYQEKQIGTGDAVKSAMPLLDDFTGLVLILYGDVPLVTTQTLKRFLKIHVESNATISLISFIVNEPNQYGRIVRDDSGKFVQKIVEARDCNEEQLKISEVNSGIYLVDSSFLIPAIKELKNENAQGEYYLTDILEHASKEGQTISALVLEDSQEVLGVNSFYDLSLVNEVLRMKSLQKFIEKGVIINNPQTVSIDSSASIDAGVEIGPNVQILGDSKISSGTKIEGTAYIKNSEIGNNAFIKFGVRMENAKLGDNCAIGPFVNLRPDTILENEVKIGNFVETKKAHLKMGAKANHLTYLGDCTVGTNSNIGAGTITCNYDGYTKSKTEIGNDVFIGSNTSLVAPVKIEDGATVGAGSVITKTVEKDSLAFTRSPQLAKSGWSKRKRDLSSK